MEGGLAWNDKPPPNTTPFSLPFYIAQVGLSIYLSDWTELTKFWWLVLHQFLANFHSDDIVILWYNGPIPLLYNRLIFSYTRNLRSEYHKLHRLPLLHGPHGAVERWLSCDLDIEQLAASLTMIFSQFFIGVYWFWLVLATNHSASDSWVLAIHGI